MDLSTELAQRCLQVKQAAAEDFAPDREEFEDLASRERIARGQAARYQDIARSRAREEAEKTPAETFTGRLYPIPHTLGEAAWRIPAVTAGGVLGYQAVAKHEVPDAEAIRRLVTPAFKETTVAGEREFSQFGQRVFSRLKALGHPKPEEMARRLEKGLLAAPDTLVELTNPLANNRVLAMAHLQELTRDPVTKKLDRNVARHVESEAEYALAGAPKGKKGGRPDPSGFFRNLLEPGKETQVKGSPERQPSPFGTVLKEQLRVQGRTPEALAAVEDLFGRKPELAQQVLSHLPDSMISEEALNARKTLESVIGSGGTKGPTGRALARQALHDAAVAGKTGLGEGLSKWRRYGGAAAGGLAAALLTGIPLGAYALWKRREGGEAAARAKARMQEELDKAEEASKQREAILARMGT